MGRASRWLRGLFGRKKSPNPNPNAKEKNNRRWGIFVKSFREKDQDGRKRVDDSYRVDDDDEEEQCKRAIAVAAATAAAAEAAVVAAQAAAAVVRLTAGGGGKRTADLAAIKIQAAFRAYLARRALRALKGLVKLQALVRGNIVRKQAAKTLRCMQALVRVQARARACRSLHSGIIQRNLSSQNHPDPSTPDKCEQPIRAHAHKPERSSTLKRNCSKQVGTNIGGLYQDQSQSSGLRWLDQWMEEHYWDTTKSSTVSMSAPLDDEKNAKILEVDTGKPRDYNTMRKSNNHVYSSYSDQHDHSFNTVPESASKDSTIAHSPSSVGFPMCFDYEESPQFLSASSSRPASSRLGPFMPLKSECSRSLFGGYADFPNYMSYTESSRAKVRSQSAPKQRPEYEKPGLIRRGSGHGLGQQWNMGQRSSLHPLANKGYPGSGALDRLGMPIKN